MEANALARRAAGSRQISCIGITPALPLDNSGSEEEERQAIADPTSSWDRPQLEDAWINTPTGCIFNGLIRLSAGSSDSARCRSRRASVAEQSLWTEAICHRRVAPSGILTGV